MKSFNVTIQPSLLIWARNAMHLSLDEAAKKISTTPEQLATWEEGSKSPTFRQLQTIAKVYKRPVAIFYLQSPPTHFDPLREYRRNLESSGVAMPYELVVELDRIKRQQDILREVYELDELEITHISFPIKITDNPEQIGTALRNWIGLTFEKQKKWAKSDSLVTRLSELIEERGVIVTQVQKISVTTMRGCALPAHDFPAIVINGADTRTAKVFTLIHELVHILMLERGDSSVLPVTLKSQHDGSSTERFCNAVSGATLIPGEILIDLPRIRNHGFGDPWNLEQLDEISAQFGVSAEAVLLRLIHLNKASWVNYSAIRDAVSERVADQQTEKGDSPPIYYQLKIRDLGKRYISEIADAYNRSTITASDMSDFLGIKANKLPNLLEKMAVSQ